MEMDKEFTIKERLARLHEDVHGGKLPDTELGQILEILEELAEKVGAQDGHGHSIS